MPSWKTSRVERDLGMYDSRVLVSAIRGLGVIVLEVASGLDGDDVLDLEFVVSRLEFLTAEVESRLGSLDGIRDELRLLQEEVEGGDEEGVD